MSQLKKKFLWTFAAVLSITMVIGIVGQKAYLAEFGRMKITTLIKQEMEGVAGKIVRVVELNLDPGASSPAHTHPGHLFVYIIEGEYELGINDDPPKLYKAGEVFYEPAGVVHRIGRNPSETERARLVSFMFLDKGKANTLPHFE